MSAPRKRTNGEIVTSLACNMTEAARVLNVAWETVRDLCETKEIRTYKSGKSTKIVVRSLIEYQDRAAA